MNLCIHDLVTATNGRLQMGSMPPLGGEMAPIGRLVRLGSEIQSGDVVLATVGGTTNGIAEQSLEVDEVHLNGAAGSRSDAWALTEAYLRGAAGVIADQFVCPWDGCFSIRVANMNQSQRNLLEHIRGRMTLPVVAVLDDDKRSTVSEGLREQVAVAGSDGVPEPTSDELLWQMIGTRATDTAVVLHVKSRHDDAILRLLRPSIVVATTKVTAAQIHRTIDLAGDNGILVLETHKKSNPMDGFDIERLPKGWQHVNAAESSSAIQVTMTSIAAQRKQQDMEADMTCQARVA